MYKKIKISGHTLIQKLSENKIYPLFSVANKFIVGKSDRKRLITANDAFIDAIIKFLHFLNEEFEIDFEIDYGLVTVELAQKYITSYMFTPNDDNDYPGDNARKAMRKNISVFLLNMKNSGKCPQLNENYIICQNGKSTVYELSIFLNMSMATKQVYRFCPEYFVEECLKQARLYDPDVFMAICLQVDAGLRPSEVCNVRVTNSSYGPGYAVRADSTKLIRTELSIDISKEAYLRPMRSDNIDVGCIKKPRIVKVRPYNIEHLADALHEYEIYTKDRKREAFGPLITNTSRKRKNGYNMAMTYDSYRKKFKNLVEKYVFPAMIERGGKEREYAFQLSGSSYGPHFFREYFTCKMVENGEKWQDIQMARGDSSPDSAIIYVIKGKAYKGLITDANEELAKMIKLYNGGALEDENQTLPLRL